MQNSNVDQIWPFSLARNLFKILVKQCTRVNHNTIAGLEQRKLFRWIY